MKLERVMVMTPALVIRARSRGQGSLESTVGKTLLKNLQARELATLSRISNQTHFNKM